MFASWSSRVTTTSSPSCQSRAAVRESAKLSEVMFAPKVTSSVGDPEQVGGGGARRGDHVVGHHRGEELPARVRVRGEHVAGDRLEHRVRHLGAGRAVEVGHRDVQRVEAVADRLDRDVEDLLALGVAHGRTLSRTGAADVRPVPVLQWASVRLRPLTEAECYARCYGGRREETVSILRFGFGGRAPDRSRAARDRSKPPTGSTDRGGRPHDARLRQLDLAPPLRPAGQGPPARAAPERLDVHRDVDVACATLSAAWPNRISDVPDVLAPGLWLRLLRHQPGRVSAAAHAHFANPRNDFWRLLHDARLHAAALRPVRAVRAARARLRRHERRLPDDARLGRPAARRLRRGPARRRSRRSFEPRAIAFVGKEAYRGALRRAPRARAAAADARLDRSLRPALDLAGERRGPVRGAAPLVPRAPRLARAGAARGRARARRRRRRPRAPAALREPGHRRRLVGDCRAAGSSPARATSRRSAASCSRRSASRGSSSARLVWERTHVFPWNRRPAPPARAVPPRARRAASRSRRRSTSAPRASTATAGGRSTSSRRPTSGSPRAASRRSCATCSSTVRRRAHRRHLA